MHPWLGYDSDVAWADLAVTWLWLNMDWLLLGCGSCAVVPQLSLGIGLAVTWLQLGDLAATWLCGFAAS
jgi:hypothetical protein